MSRLKAVLAAVAVLALAGCGSGGAAKPSSAPSVAVASTVSAPPARYGSVTELRDAAVAAGYICPSWVQDNVVVLAAESGHCSDADVFTTYASPGQLDGMVTQTKTNNQMLASATVAVNPTLVGENWMIHGEGAIEIQPKMGGTILQ